MRSNNNPIPRLRLLSVLGSGYLLLLGGCGVQPHGPQDAITAPRVFFPRYNASNCEQQIRELEAGTYETLADAIAKLNNNDWSQKSYSLHSLHFLDCLLQKGAKGDLSSLEKVKAVILDWDAKNNFAQKSKKWNWGKNYGATEEHGAAWRAVLLSSAYRVVHDVTPSDRAFLAKLQAMAQEHGDFLSGTVQYQHDHNHGLNQSLALVALGVTFTKLPDAPKWVELGLARAEQQMKDNVVEGINLEQSGFYQLFTLRTFMEIALAAQAIDRPVSEDYKKQLDKMLEVAALYAGADGVVTTLPWSNHYINVFDYLKDVDKLPLSEPAPGRDLYLKMAAQENLPGVFLNPQGGYSFLRGAKGSIDVTLHNRLLKAPHLQFDPLGITVNLDDQRVISYGNFPLDDRSINDFNIVQVKGLELKLADVDRKTPLRARLNANSGDILASGDSPSVQYITAQHHLYAGVTQTRTIARIGSRYLLVWDRLISSNDQEYSQSFHFPVPSTLKLSQNRGEVILNQKRLAQFVQLQPKVEINICSNDDHSDPLCSLDVFPDGKKIPTPEVNYRARGKSAEFLWVLAADGGDFTAEVRTLQSGNTPKKEVLLSGTAGNYRITLDNLKVSLVQ